MLWLLNGVRAMTPQKFGWVSSIALKGEVTWHLSCDRHWLPVTVKWRPLSNTYESWGVFNCDTWRVCIAVPERKPSARDEDKHTAEESKVKTIQPLDAEWYWGEMSRCVVLILINCETSSRVSNTSRVSTCLPLHYQATGGVVVGRRTCDQKIASSTPGRCIAW